MRKPTIALSHQKLQRNLTSRTPANLLSKEITSQLQTNRSLHPLSHDSASLNTCASNGPRVPIFLKAKQSTLESIQCILYNVRTDIENGYTLTVKAIRTATGMTQRSFSEAYHIPLQTLKQWESKPTSSAYRHPPEYVLHMLKRLVSLDFGIEINTPKTRVEHLIEAAEQSRYNASHWMRYLRKQFDGDSLRLSEHEIEDLLDAQELSMFQKVSLARAAQANTETSKYVASLNMKAQARMLEEVKRRLENAAE